MENSNPIDFSERTGLPHLADKSELEKLGARCFISAKIFPYEGVVSRIEQMQYQKDNSVYIWKRIVPIEFIDPNIQFQIHAEFSPSTISRFKYVKEPPQKATSNEEAKQVN